MLPFGQFSFFQCSLFKLGFFREELHLPCSVCTASCCVIWARCPHLCMWESTFHTMSLWPRALLIEIIISNCIAGYMWSTRYTGGSLQFTAISGDQFSLNVVLAWLRLAQNVNLSVETYLGKQVSANLASRLSAYGLLVLLDLTNLWWSPIP